MAKDKNVISLDERRRGSGHGSARGHASRTEPAAPAAGASDPAAGAPQTPVPGRLIWLYCPACRTVEYTELAMAGGRVHNVCGTQVQEAAVELDLRAEHTVARINLERLGVLEQLLASQRQRYEEYLHRLNVAAGRPLEPYAVSDESAAALPVADVDALGLLVSRFFHNPAAHFAELTGAGPDAGAGTDPMAEPPPAPPRDPSRE